jgi:hypothetical protein
MSGKENVGVASNHHLSLLSLSWPSEEIPSSLGPYRGQSSQRGWGTPLDSSRSAQTTLGGLFL